MEQIAVIGSLVLGTATVKKGRKGSPIETDDCRLNIENLRNRCYYLQIQG